MKKFNKDYNTDEYVKHIAMAFYGSIMVVCFLSLVGVFIAMFNLKAGDFQDFLENYMPIALGVSILGVIVATFISARIAYLESGIRAVVKGLGIVFTTGGFIALIVAWIVGLLVAYPYAPAIGIVLIFIFIFSIFGL